MSILADVPLISVLMSVYNGERYLRDAIDSILAQTFRDFEFIIIDDGSTDETSAILAHYRQKDKRIRIYEQKNQGVVPTLNKGCCLAKGEYIARMDADDVSLPERFARQISFMEAHPEVGALGTWIEYINEKGVSDGNWRLPTKPGFVSWKLFFGNHLVHPSVLMRRDIIEKLGFYRQEALHAEDYDLWARASFITQLANIPDILLQKRVWDGRVSSLYAQTQERNAIGIMHLMIKKLLDCAISYELIVDLEHVLHGSTLENIDKIESVANIIKQLYKTFINTHCLSREEANEIANDAGKMLLSLMVQANKYSLWKSIRIFVDSIRLNPQLSIRFVIDSVKQKALAYV